MIRFVVQVYWKTKWHNREPKNWPLRHHSLNTTKPNAYLNVWGRRGFTLEQSCSNMHYLHSVQLPSHCGLGKQYSSPILPPAPKKPPPKLVFLWPVIKTWVWMRASVSPGKITHSHSQWGGNQHCVSGSSSTSDCREIIYLDPHTVLIGGERNWLGHVLHLPDCWLSWHVHVCREPAFILYMRDFLHIQYVRDKKTPATDWLGRIGSESH